MQRFANSALRLAAAIVAALALDAHCAHAVVLFSDNFDRPNSRNIDASLSSIVNNTGTTLPVDGVYTHAFVDPANDPGPQDGSALNGGGAQIINNTLQLAVGAGTSNAFVNHNFTNASILSAGAFRVSLDVTGYNQSTNGQGGAFAIGMTQAEALSGDDAFDGNPANAKYTNAFLGDFQDVISDFWVGLRGDGVVSWGNGPVAPNMPGYGSANVGIKTGTISANFGVSSFSAGASVNYEIFFNSTSIGVGSFAWSDANANYIGLDARDNTGVSLDNFLVETSTPPALPSLTINRDTGNITLRNQTSQPLSIAVYSIATQSGAFLQNNWATIEAQNLDLNDEWFKLTAPGSQTDLSEGTLGEYTIGPNGAATDRINFGNAWRKSPFEDVAVEVRNAAGNAVPMIVNYTGNGGHPFGLADYNANGIVDPGDWPTLRNHLISDVSAMSRIDAYFRGDLNGDGLVNRLDFRQFKSLFEAQIGVGSFAAMIGQLTVPEPSTAAMLVIVSLTGMLARRRRLRHLAAATLVLCAAVTVAPDAWAVNLFTDSFDRPDNANIDAVKTGITGTVGTALAADGVYLSPHLDPNNPAIDADAANGGGQDITANQLRLAVGFGTSNAYVNHNFTDAAILTDRGFSVSLDVAAYSQTTTGQGGGFAVGMSQAEAALGSDASDSLPNNSKFTGGFGPATNISSDFWLALRGDNSLIWGSGNTVAGTVTGLAAKTGTISAKFATHSLDAGRSVAYEVFHNGVSQGFGAFAWSESNANYIGIDARDAAAVQLDNFSINSVTDATPSVLRLRVNTSNGTVSIAGGAVANSLDYYEIHSAGTGLVSGNFAGLAAAPGFPAGNGTGNGWELNGVQSSALLSESYFQASSTIAGNASAVSLGAIYNTTLNTRDLQFFYDLPNGTTRRGFVEYISLLLPDFNGNGVVDAADYTVWRNNLGLMGGATLAHGDANGDGNVTAADYSIWKANFGAVTGAGADSVGGVAAPEPTSVVLLLVAAIAVTGVRICAPPRKRTSHE